MEEGGSPAATAAALLAVSVDGRIVSGDARFCTLAGMPTAVLGKGTIAPVIRWLRESGDDLGHDLAGVLTSVAASRDQGEITSAGGRVIEWISTPLEYGDLHGRIWTFRETTDYRAALRALRDAESWLRMFAAHHDGVVFEVDEGACIVGLWARADAAFFGVPEAELRGRTVLDVLGPVRGGELDARIRGVLTSGVPDSFEVAIQHAASRVFAVNAVLLPRNGEAASVTVLIRDVTEEARLHAQLRQAERLASVGLLAAGVAHEINNPLGYMLLNMQRVRRGLAEVGAYDVSPSQAETLADLDRSMAITLEGAGRVQEIVRDLKHFARSGYDEPRVAVDIHRVLAFTMEIASAELKPRARVVHELGPVPSVTASEGRLGQLFLNLVLNAAQAIPEGNPEGNEIRIVTRTDEAGRARIEVHDTGIGIPDDELDHIFDPFFTTKAPGVGTGLGLAICHGITTAFGGVISVETRQGQGSVFRVVFPPCDFVSDASS